MFELPSAMFSIADGNEFRFARFYIVCEAIRLEALESPLIVCACRIFPAECSKLGKTGIIVNGKRGRNRNSVFCDSNSPARFHPERGCPLAFGLYACNPLCCARRCSAIMERENGEAAV